MNWKSTLALVVLAGAAGAWYFMGDAWGPKVGITPAHPEPPKTAAAAALDSLDPAAVSRVEVVFPAGDPLVVERAATESGWKMPGNWPPRTGEVDDLVRTLGGLRSRFQAVPLPEGADLAAFGLAPGQKPLVVKLVADGQPVTLAFGEPKPSGDETAFTRPGYVRVNAGPEVLKVGPDVLPVLRRPAEAYRRRSLFPDVERVRVAGAAPAANPFGPPPAADAGTTVTLPGPTTESITVHRPPVRLFGLDLNPVLGSFTLSREGPLPAPGVLAKGAEPTLQPDRIADAWKLTSPVADRAEPGALRGILAAVADLWVDRFVPAADAGFAHDSRYAIALLVPVPFDSPLAEAARLAPDVGFLDPLKAKFPAADRLGFAPDGPGVTVKRQGADAVTVRFGGIAKATEREETVTVPGGPPGTPPRTIPRKVTTEFRFARLDGNPQLFVVEAGKIPDLFATPAELADSRVARFDRDEVQKVTVSHPGRPDLTLLRKKGNPRAEDPEEQADRWVIAAEPNPLLADTGRVEDLIGKLAGLRADDQNRRTYPATTPPARATVTVVAREKRAEGEPAAPDRTYTLAIGTPDVAKRLLPVGVNGSSRVTLADDKLGPDDPDGWLGPLFFPDLVSGLIDRPTIAYRNRRLFDAADKLRGVSVPGKFAVKQDASGWKLTVPFASAADPGAAGKLAAAVAGLAATEFLTETPAAADLAAFGLEKPAHTAALEFANGRTYTLSLGAARPGKPEVFARLDTGGVFALTNAAAEHLTGGALGLLPLQVWSAKPEAVTALEVTRTGDAAKDSFALAKGDPEWKLSGPFTAGVPFASATPTLATLGNLTAAKYHALTADNPAEFGFDKPFLTVKLAFTEKNDDGPGTPITKTLVVGNPGPEFGTRFAKLDGPNTPVFLVRNDFVTAAQVPPLDLLDRKLLALNPAIIDRVKVTTGKPEEAFTLLKDAAGKWAAEGSTFAVDAERIARLTAAAGTPPVARIAAYGDVVKWADFGLEKPDTIIEVSEAGGKPHAIALGGADPTGSRFARVDGGKAVAVIPTGAAEALGRKRFEYADRTLLTFDPTTLAGLTRTAGKAELELLPAATGIGWDIAKPAKQKADPPFVDELADALGRLKADRVAGYGKKDEVFKPFGLDTPAATLTLLVGDKMEPKVLRIGNPVDAAKPDGERYAAVDAAAPEVIVGVLPAAVANKLLAPPVAFRDRSLAKFVDADKAVLERGDRKVTFAKVGTAWKVTEPLATAAESAELEALVADLGKLRADTWVAEKGKDLKPFGLDPPEARWTLSDGDKTVLVLLVGKTAADGRAHATTDKGELVGLLDPAMSNRVLAEYRQRRPWDVDAAQVSAIEVAQGDAKFTLLKAGPGWIDPEKPDAINAGAVNELLGTLGALRAERYAADKDADLKLFGLEKPEFTIAAAQGPAKKVLEIGAAVGGTDGKQRYARVADAGRSDVFVLSAIDTARLTRDRGAYVVKK